MDSLELTFKPYKARSVVGNSTLSFRVFQGTIRLSINDEANKLLLDKPLAPNKITAIRRILHKALTISPGQKLPIIFSAYNTEVKKMEVEWVLTILKDDKQVYHICVEWAAGGKHDFMLKGPYGISFGSDPMADGEKSTLELETLIDFFTTTAPLYQVNSNYKEYWTNTIQQRRDNNPRGGGGSKAAGADDDGNYF